MWRTARRELSRALQRIVTTSVQSRVVASHRKPKRFEALHRRLVGFLFSRDLGFGFSLGHLSTDLERKKKEFGHSCFNFIGAGLVHSVV
jgi:hypothetical protein